MRIGCAGDLDLAAVGLMNAAQDLGQGGFAGAVVADDRQDFPLANVDVDILSARTWPKVLDSPRHSTNGASDNARSVSGEGTGARESRPVPVASKPLT